ncbi:MAG: geranyl transferase [Burkholderiales bacterium]|jgi:farnesyl diphosphate synthase|nr:geranyl transferase [Burkholderiales bacterium]
MLEKYDYLGIINDRLNNILRLENGNAGLIEPIRYSVLGGGKRIRPLLSIASGRINAADFDAVLDIGCALELIHCYSLVHDDLPAMDNDDLRRGLATCHKKYDEATAILVGDALQSLAFEVLSAPTLNLPQESKLKIINLVSKASGISGMVGGQLIDLYSTGQELTLTILQNMHAQKTGALIRAAILSGYLCGSAFSLDKYNTLSQIADSLGLLFQIMDDILDVTQSSHTLGKTANKDIINDKATYVSLLGLEEARGIADELYREIITDLSRLKNSAMLQEIATIVYKRNH